MTWQAPGMYDNIIEFAKYTKGLKLVSSRV